MAGRNMLLDVIVRMRDLMSGPLSKLRAGIQSIANMAKKIGAVGSAIAAISFLAPINEAAAFQQKLLDIAATQGLAGRAAFEYVEKAKAKFEDLSLKVGQSSNAISGAAAQMIAAGVDEKLIDASIGTIGKAATAATADINDMASVATSLLTTLKLPSEQLENSLGALVVAGKLGSFELKDMSRFFATLTGQMAKFGVTGREAVNFLAAALQIARKGTSNPEEAANNLKNFLSKILAPDTIKKFADMGVDIEAVMKNAAVKGINPIEAVVQKIVKLTGISGKEIEGLMKKAKAAGMTDVEALAQVRSQLEKTYGAGKLGKLFGDMQVLDFLIPMLGNLEEYKRIKEEVAKATGADIDPDFETKMQSLAVQLTIFRDIGEQAIREVGLAFGTWLPVINRHLSSMLKWLRETDKATGGMVRQFLSFAGAAVALAAALGALGFVLPAITAGFSAMMMPLRGIGQAMRFLGTASGQMIGLQTALKGAPLTGIQTLAAGLRGIVLAVPGLGAISSALSAIGAALGAISAPLWAAIVAVVLALAAAGVMLWKYWSRVSAIMSGVGRAIAEQLAPAIQTVRPLLDGFALAGEWIAAGWSKAMAAMSAFGDWLGSFFQRELLSDKQAAAFEQSGHDLATRMIEGIKSKIGELIEWFRSLPGRVMAAIGSIDLAGLIKWPNPPSWVTWLVGGGGDGSAPAAAGNDNRLPAQAGGGGKTELRGSIGITVTGPGTVTSAESSNPAVPLKANTGRVVGRN